jgi:hypothetical protein
MIIKPVGSSSQLDLTTDAQKDLIQQLVDRGF